MLPSSTMEQCIDTCLACHRACTEALGRCLACGGDHVASEHLNLLLDCAEVCRTSANLMMRGSERHGMTCGVCAQVCEDCAKECDDSDHADCADACRACADSCKVMASGSDDGHAA